MAVPYSSLYNADFLAPVLVTIKTPEQTLTEARVALNEMRPEIARRTTGVLIYPDGKEPCKAGAFADDIGAAKTSEFDPNHCLISGGPWVRPVLERNITCQNAGEDLVWGSLIQKAQTHLKALATRPPELTAGWELKLDYVNVVLELCDIVLQGTNLPPYAVQTWLSWAVGVDRGDASESKASRLAPAADTQGYPSIAFLDKVISRPNDSFVAQFGQRPFWLRGRGGFGPQTPGFNWDTTPIFAPPVLKPTYFAADGFGWAPWISANSRFQKIVQGEVTPYAQGFFGANAGQSHMLSNIAYSKQNWGRDWVFSTCIGSDCGMHRFVLPAKVCERLVAGSTTDRGKAEQALRKAMTMPPHDLMRMIFQETALITPDALLKAWSFDRIYKVTWYGMPEPARTIDEVREVRTLSAQFYVMRAQDWAKWCGNMNTAAVLQAAALEYLTKAKKVVETLAARGLPVDLKPTDIQAMISSVEATKAGERMAVVAGLSSVFQIMGGIAGAIMQLVATAVLGGFLEFLNSSKPPSGQADFGLLLQPFALRSPGKQTICSFDPTAEGGAQGIVSNFIPMGYGGTGQLFDLSQGRNPPPPAPEALRELSASDAQALEDLVVAARSNRRLMWGLGIAGVLLGGALVFRNLK